jgi:hypothetical protein
MMLYVERQFRDLRKPTRHICIDSATCLAVGAECVVFDLVDLTMTYCRRC